MPHKVHLTYFRSSGKYLSRAVLVIDLDPAEAIWAEVQMQRRLGRLPGIHPNAGRDLFVLVETPYLPPRLIKPPLLDEDDETPTLVPLREMVPPDE